jgi:hypothetical protein
MALLVDPDNLTYEVAGTPSGSFMLTVDTAGGNLYLTEVGALSADGVTGQCLYSKLKEIWKDDSALIPFPFPMEAITPESFEVLSTWTFGNATTRNLIRNAGWAERNSSGNIIAMYAGIISLGTLGGSDQPYFDNDGTVTNFTYTGPINEAIQILDDPNGDGNYVDGFDRRSTLTVYAREQAKSYANADLASIGVTTMTYQAYRFPLANATDLKVTESDVTVDAYGVTITFHNVAQSRLIGGVSRDFGVIIDGNNRTAEEIYMAVQSALRKATDIDNDAGAPLVGQLAPELLAFVGDTLTTLFAVNPDGGGGGVYIDNFQSNDTNRITFQDNLNTTRQFPFVSAGTINFNTNLQSEANGDAKFWMFFDHTIRDTVADFAISGVSGQTASLDSVGGNLPTLAQNDYIRVTGSANDANNGVWQITDATPSATQADATKVEGETPVNETAFSATVDQDPFGSVDAVLVDDNGGVDITGDINGQASVAFDFDYDGNVQSGRTAGTDAEVVLVAIGTDDAQYVVATGTITRATGLSFTLTAQIERNYSNP